MSAIKPCPCGSERTFADCCQPLLRGERSADTALALMRSRYSAYCGEDADYLLATLHPSRHQAGEREALQASFSHCQWRGLVIRDCSGGGAGDVQGEVEFIASFKQQGRFQRLHERSRFVREDGRWYYLDGDSLPS